MFKKMVLVLVFALSMFLLAACNDDVSVSVSCDQVSCTTTIVNNDSRTEKVNLYLYLESQGTSKTEISTSEVELNTNSTESFVTALPTTNDNLQTLIDATVHAQPTSAWFTDYTEIHGYTILGKVNPDFSITCDTKKFVLTIDNETNDSELYSAYLDGTGISWMNTSVKANSANIITMDLPQAQLIEVSPTHKDGDYNYPRAYCVVPPSSGH